MNESRLHTILSIVFQTTSKYSSYSRNVGFLKSISIRTQYGYHGFTNNLQITFICSKERLRYRINNDSKIECLLKAKIISELLEDELPNKIWVPIKLNLYGIKFNWDGKECFDFKKWISFENIKLMLNEHEIIRLKAEHESKFFSLAAKVNGDLYNLEDRIKRIERLIQSNKNTFIIYKLASGELRSADVRKYPELIAAQEDIEKIKIEIENMNIRN